MSKKIWLFYKGQPIEYCYNMDKWEVPVGTFCHNPEAIYIWTQLITVRKGTAWAKVALRNVPKKYRALLLILE